MSRVVVGGGEGAILDLLVIDTSVVNTLGYRPDSLTRLFVHTSVEKRRGGGGSHPTFGPAPSSALFLFPSNPILSFFFCSVSH